MTFQTHIRDDLDPSVFVKHSSHSTYKSAGEAGQLAAGFFNFYVETPGSYVPTRDEQLLLSVPARKAKTIRHQLTVNLAMED